MASTLQRPACLSSVGVNHQAWLFVVVVVVHLFILRVSVCVWAHACHGVHVDNREQLLGVSSHLPPWGSWGPHSGSKGRQMAFFTIQPSHRWTVLVLDFHFFHALR